MALCLLPVFAAPTKADTIFETGTFTGTDLGDYSIYDGRYLGAKASGCSLTVRFPPCLNPRPGR